MIQHAKLGYKIKIYDAEMGLKKFIRTGAFGMAA